jgi:hypothetical protein
MAHPEYQLQDGKIQGMVLYCFEDERPMRGWIGELDWRFQGHFSRWNHAQHLTGKFGEAVYAPLKWNEKTFHFLVIGAGQVQGDGLRPPCSKALQDVAKKRWKELGLGLESQFLFENWS